MALKQSKQTQAGVIVEYWKISSIHLDIVGQWAEIIIVPFVSEQARLQNFAPLSDEAMMILIDINNNDSEFENYFTSHAMTQIDKNIIQISYEYIKAKVEFFQDSIDC